jgi:hypothetical protein
MIPFLFWFTVTFGFQTFDYITPDSTFYRAPLYTEIEIHAENNWLDIYGIYRNEMDKGRGIFFRPYEDTFIVGVAIGAQNTQLIFEHMCRHPVANIGYTTHDEFAGYNRIAVKFRSNP